MNSKDYKIEAKAVLKKILLRYGTFETGTSVEKMLDADIDYFVSFTIEAARLSIKEENQTK